MFGNIFNRAAKGDESPAPKFKFKGEKPEEFALLKSKIREIGGDDLRRDQNELDRVTELVGRRIEMNGIEITPEFLDSKEVAEIFNEEVASSKTRISIAEGGVLVGLKDYGSQVAEKTAQEREAGQ